MIRQPIICVLGHVDHGKTTLLDYLRGSNIVEREAGRITQHIGATEVPIETIKEKCSALLSSLNIELKIPGLLFLDTPGHQAFSNLRKRGGSVADLAILVVDINQGIQPQTVESLEILKTFKTPFIIAATKIDVLRGWNPKPNACFLETFNQQREDVKQELEEKIYRIVAQLGEHGFSSERFDRVQDFTKEVLIVPVSGKTGEGIPDLLLYTAGLVQKYLADRLEIDINAPGEGTVLEVKEVKGLGTTVDIILYNGCLKKDDEIMLWGKNGIIKTRIRALLKPAPLKEIRDTKGKFQTVDMVHAAAGIKISAPGLEDAIAGSSVYAIRNNEEEIKEKIMQDIQEITIDTEETGVIVKADTLGSLEAIIGFLKEHNIPIRKADIGIVTKKDVIEAVSVKKENRYLGVVFAFNQEISPDAAEEAGTQGVEIIKTNVIYQILDEYKEYVERERKKEKEEKLRNYIYPAKIKILEGFVFRKSKPAIVGVEVLAGIIRPKYPLMNEEGKIVGTIVGIQDKGHSLEYAEKGAKVAVSIDGGVVDRNIFEGDVLYTAVPLEHLEVFHDIDDKELLKEIRNIRWKR